MTVFKILRKSTEQFFKTGLWSTHSKPEHSKIWGTAKAVKAAAAGKQIERIDDMIIIEYELVEKKRYKFNPKNKNNIYVTSCDLIEISNKETISDILTSEYSSPDWSAI